MRYQQWRLMLLRSYHGSHLPYPSPCSQFQVTSISTRSLSSLVHIRSGTGSVQQSQQLGSPMTSSAGLMKSVGRSFSSEPAIKEKSSAETIVIDVFSRLSGEDEIKKELESSDIVISQDLALKVLRKLESNPDVAKRFDLDVNKVQMGTHSFTFGHVYGSNGSPSSSMFGQCVAPLVDGLFHGYNATVLASDVVICVSDVLRDWDEAGFCLGCL